MKKLLSISIAALMTIGLTNVLVPQQVESEESSPKVVYTDTWTTSYFIDGDTETLYPYIKCTANVFDDGTLRVYFENTQKWEDSDDKRHYITIVGTSPSTEYIDHPFSDESNLESTYISYPVDVKFDDKNGVSHYNGKFGIGSSYAFGELSQEIDYTPKANYSYWKSLDFSYPSKDYTCSVPVWTGTDAGFYPEGYAGCECIIYSKDKYSDEKKLSVKLIKMWNYEGKLSELPVNKKQLITCTPYDYADLSKNSHKFRLFSHDITITPEMLNGSNATTEPTVTPTTAPTQSNADKIKELEAQVKTLTEENEKLKSRNVFDLNDDGKVNVLDLIKLKNYLLGI